MNANEKPIELSLNVVPPGARTCTLCLLEESDAGRIDFFVMGFGTAVAASRRLSLCLHHAAIVRSACSDTLGLHKQPQAVQ